MIQPVRPLTAFVLAASLLTGCQVENSDPFGHNRDGKDQTVKPEDRPPMETMLTRYRAFQTDLFAQLAKQFGTHAWGPLPGSLGFDRAGCSHGELADGEQILLGDMSFDGSFPIESWNQVRDAVIEIGKEHGFTHVTILVDKPGDYMTFVGDDRYGAEYQFGTGGNTTFGIITGCHRWSATPAPPSYTPPTAF